MKNIKEALDHKKSKEITIKYHSDHRKQGYELADKQKNPTERFSRKPTSKLKSNSVLKKCLIAIVCCCVTQILSLRTRLGFKQYDVILTKGQSVLTKIISSFKEENMETQYNVLSYRIAFYFMTISSW